MNRLWPLRIIVNTLHQPTGGRIDVLICGHELRDATDVVNDQGVRKVRCPYCLPGLDNIVPVRGISERRHRR